MYLVLLILATLRSHTSRAALALDLHALESSEVFNVRRYAGFCLNTVIVTVLAEQPVTRVVDGCAVVWSAGPAERLVESWIYEKAGGHLMLEVYAVGDAGSRRDGHFIFGLGRWRSVNFSLYHTLLRALRLSSKPLAAVEYGALLGEDHDACVEFDAILSKCLGAPAPGGSPEDSEQQESLLTRACCCLAACLL